MPNVHHVIGKSQNKPESIPMFLRKHAADPAIAVCLQVPSFTVMLILVSEFRPQAKSAFASTAQGDAAAGGPGQRRWD
jgi:hypothetical protein